ncbi:DUF3427 domain-containing protein [Thalassobacillus sp. CUG 92003]|uniref:DUF3427 domain-containing protein n=1 Tax=Thalassobacillus sp. CUG 92003 TaxID=2736641 RepID=UPI0015E70078
MQGIVKIPNTDNFVFFVTFGHSEGNHEFKESIEDNGILNWQSQPKQKLAHPRIQELINHEHTRNNIYLFLRTRKNEHYPVKKEVSIALQVIHRDSRKIRLPQSKLLGFIAA